MTETKKNRKQIFHDNGEGGVLMDISPSPFREENKKLLK